MGQGATLHLARNRLFNVHATLHLARNRLFEVRAALHLARNRLFDLLAALHLAKSMLSVDDVNVMASKKPDTIAPGFLANRSYILNGEDLTKIR